MIDQFVGIPDGYRRIEVYEVYTNGHDLVVLGDPDEHIDHNCDAMGCGTFDHVLIHCAIPDWQATQLRVQPIGYRAVDSDTTPIIANG